MLKRIINTNNKYFSKRYSHIHTKPDFTQKKCVGSLEDKLNELQKLNETNFNELRETNETFYYFMKSKHEFNEFKMIEMQQTTEDKLNELRQFNNHKFNEIGFICYITLMMSGLTLLTPTF
jgi:hypothetical protein